MPRLSVFAILLAAVGLAACTEAEAETTPQRARVWAAQAAAAPDEQLNPRLLRRFQPLPRPIEPDEEAAELATLGRELFYDRRLSRDGTISCNSCHTLTEYGVDHQRTSAGFGGKRGRRNSPTVYNAGGHVAQFWDGRASDLEAQVQGPLFNAGEMGMTSPAAVVKALKAIPHYRTAFGHAFPSSSDPITTGNISVAIGAFERRLMTPGRWDDYLRGNRQALTLAERRGLRTFLNIGCMNCHTGPYLGGSMFEKLGVMEPWPDETDLGREEVTKLAGDKMVFKVPSLRNVLMTAPYFHDGSAATLEDAVRLMAKHQLGTTLSEEDVSSIVVWLSALSSPLPPAEAIADPWKK